MLSLYLHQSFSVQHKASILFITMVSSRHDIIRDFPRLCFERERNFYFVRCLGCFHVNPARLSCANYFFNGIVPRFVARKILTVSRDYAQLL